MSVFSRAVVTVVTAALLVSCASAQGGALEGKDGPSGFFIGDVGSSGMRLYYYNDAGEKQCGCSGKLKTCDSDNLNTAFPKIRGGKTDLKDWAADKLKKMRFMCGLAEDSEETCEGVDKKVLEAAFDNQMFYLEATAGLRGEWLSTSRKLEKEAGGKDVNNHLMEKWIVDGFNDARGNKKTVFKVVQGRWEGYFGLVSAYLHAADPQTHVGEVLKCDKNTGGKFCEKEMVYFEVGGASQQIAFAQCSKAEIAADKAMTAFLEEGSESKGPMHLGVPKATLGDFAQECKTSDGDAGTFDIYSRSWLGDGMDRLDAGLVSVLFKANELKYSRGEPLEMGCWRKGVKVKMSSKKLVFDGKIVADSHALNMKDHQALKELDPEKLTPDNSMTRSYKKAFQKGMEIVGTGNHRQCVKDIELWLEKGLDETRPHPGFGYAKQIAAVQKLVEAKAKDMGGRKNLKWVISSNPLAMGAFPTQHFKDPTPTQQGVISVRKANKQSDKASKELYCKKILEKEGGIADWDEEKALCKPRKFKKQPRLIGMKTLRRFAKWACNVDAAADKYSYAQCKMATFFDIVLRKFGICKGTTCSDFVVYPMDWTEGAAKMHADSGEAEMFNFNHNNANENKDVIAK